LRIVIMGGKTASFFLYNTHSMPIPTPNEGKIGNALNTSGCYPFISDNLLKAYYVRLEGFVTLRRLILKETILGRIVQSWNALQDLWHVPFFFEDNRHVFYVTTTEETVLIPAQTSYGIAHPGVAAETVATLPPLVARTQTASPVRPTFHGDGSPVEARLGAIDPVPIQRFVTEDAYIRQGLGTIGEVTFGNKRIGPAGSISKT
jgi:hypothetical protein